MRDRRVREAKLEAEFLSNEVGSLLADEKSGRIGVRAEVVWADTEVDALQVLRAVDAKTLVDDTTLLAWLHRARP